MFLCMSILKQGDLISAHQLHSFSKNMHSTLLQTTKVFWLIFNLISDYITRNSFFVVVFLAKTSSFQLYLSYVFVDSRNWNPTKTHGWPVGDSVVERGGWRCWNMRRSPPTSSSTSAPSAIAVVVCMNCRYVGRLGQSAVVSLTQRIEGSDTGW